MNIEVLKARKKELGLTNAALAELSGISLGSINKIFSGDSANPRVKTIKALEMAMGLEQSNGNAGSNTYNYIQDTDTPTLCESVQYKVKKTVADVEALPEDVRVELIDGVIYEMAAPTRLHQSIVGYIFYKIYSYIESKGGPCRVYVSPLDVQLDKDEYTMVEPDVIIVCDPENNKRKRIFGAPDWALEVVSPSSKFRDYLLKAQKYMVAGVKEYWIVDAGSKKATVYNNTGEELKIETYALNELIPVGIYDDLSIDVSWILEEIEE